MRKLLLMSILVFWWGVLISHVSAQRIELTGTTILTGTTTVGGTGGPTLVSISGKNSLLTVALSTSGGAGIIPTSTCASFSYCLPFAETSLAGNLAIIPFQYGNGGTPVTATATDDLSDSYTCIGSSAEDGSTGKYLNMCYSVNLPGTTATNGAHKVSVTFGTTAVTQVTAQAAMFYNVATTSPLRTSATQVGTSNTTMTGPTLATNVNDLVFAYFCRTGTTVMTSGSFTPAAGFTLGLAQYQDGCASEFEISTGGNVTPTMTMGSASTYIVFAAVFVSSKAGTAPALPYLQRVQSWSSPSSTSTASWKFQFPNSASDLLVMTGNGATNYAGNTITDTGTNSWVLAGQCLASGTCLNSGGYSYEFYVQNAAANSTNTQTVNFTGTGDTTIFFYDFVGMPASTFTNRGQFASNATTTTLLSASPFSFTPNATGVLVVANGPISFNTAISVSSPSGISNYFDGGFFGGETINGGGVPESIIDQNQIWSHSYSTGVVSAQSWQWNAAASTSEVNDVGADLLSFITPSGIGIVNTANAQGTSGTDIQLTVPATIGGAGDLLVISTGFFDGATIRTVSKVCTGTSASCTNGTQFTQLPSAASTDTSALFGTDIWYLVSPPPGITTITVVYSGATTGNEVSYWEASKGSRLTWAADGGNHINAGATASGTSTGATVSPTGTQDFCVGHIDVSGTGVTANPKSGNSFVYPPAPTAPTFSTSGGAAASLLTTLTSAQGPVWTTSAGTFNSSTGCFK